MSSNVEFGLLLDIAIVIVVFSGRLFIFLFLCGFPGFGSEWLVDIAGCLVVALAEENIFLLLEEEEQKAIDSIAYFPVRIGLQRLQCLKASSRFKEVLDLAFLFGNLEELLQSLNSIDKQSFRVCLAVLEEINQKLESVFTEQTLPELRDCCVCYQVSQEEVAFRDHIQMSALLHYF